MGTPHPAHLVGPWVRRFLTVASSGRCSHFLIAREASKAADSSVVQRRVWTLSYEFFPIRNCFPCSGIALIGRQSNADADVSTSADANAPPHELPIDTPRQRLRRRTAITPPHSGLSMDNTERWPQTMQPPNEIVGGLHGRNDPYRTNSAPSSARLAAPRDRGHSRSLRR